MGLLRGFIGLTAPPACFACGGQSYQPLCESCLLMLEELAEPLCPVCGHPTVEAVDCCSVCRRARPAFDSARALGAYEFPLRETIIGMKRRDGRCLAGQVAPLIAAALPQVFENTDLITFVPMAPGPENTRGHNQAQLLALAISSVTGVRAAGTLRLTRYTKDQGQLKPADRPANVAAAFAPRNRSRRLAELIADRRLVLIDDVLTTGATASACAATLKKAGAAGVDVVTLARAVHTQRPS